MISEVYQLKSKICISLALAAMLLCSCSVPVYAPVTPATALPAPTEIAADSNIVVQPIDQSVRDGGDCSFIAIHRELLSCTWHFVSPSGDADIEIGMITDYFPDLGAYSDEYTELLICNITKELDGWSVYCVFEDGAQTRNARIKIDPYL